MRGGTVPADARTRSFFPCCKRVGNAHLRAPKSLCKGRAKGCVRPPAPPRAVPCAPPPPPVCPRGPRLRPPVGDRVPLPGARRRRSPAGWVQEAFGTRRPGTRGESCGGPRCSRLGVAVGGRVAAGAGRAAFVGMGVGFWPGKLAPCKLSLRRRPLPFRSAPSPPLPRDACPSRASTELEPALL